MKTMMLFLTTIFLIAGLILAPAAPVAAQDVLPPEPETIEPQAAGDTDALLAEQGLVLQEDVWVNPGLSSEAEEFASAQATYSKADAFGYRYTRTSYNWINAVDLGTRIDDENDGYYLIDLPFIFRFYGYPTSALKVSRYGYLAWPDEYRNTSQSQLNSVNPPNNVIAPYWSPLRPADGDNGVYMASGGEEPNRWVAIEWFNWMDSQYANFFTFEVVLYENGEILFQYENMLYDDEDGKWVCGAGGIEDKTGKVALNTLKFCGKPVSSSAVKIVPPAPSARLAFPAAVSGGLAAPGGMIEHRFTLENIGDLGADVFDLTYQGKWPAVLYGLDAEESLIPLVDSDGDKKIDTGSVEQDGRFTIIVQITIPAKYKISSRYDSTLTATSSLNKKKTKTVKMENAVAAHFAQVYARDGQASVFTSGAGGVQTRALDQSDISSPGIVETAGGRLVHYWQQDGVFFYTVYEHDGTTLREPAALLPEGSPVSSIYYLFAAPNPYGGVGFVFVSDDEGASNVYYTAFDEAGNNILAPVNVTLNEIPEDEDGRVYLYPELAVTANDTLIISWRQNQPYLSIANIGYAVLKTSGEVIRDPAQLTLAGGPDASYANPAVLRLAGNRHLIGWTYYLRTGKPGQYKNTYYVQYMIFDSFGNLVYKPASIKAGEFAENLEAAQMSNGEVVLVWRGKSKGSIYPYYAILNAKSYKKTKGPSSLKFTPALPATAGYINVAADRNGYAAVTWRDINNQSLYYALLGKNGAIKTKPMLYLPAASPELNTSINYNGNGITSYGLRRPVNVTITVTVPKTTDATAKAVYLAGNFNGWDPAGTPMTRVDKTHWKVTIAGLSEGYPLLYKYTLGSWDDVEKGKKCVEINDRVIDLAFGATGAMKKSDTVANWRSVLPCTGE